MREEELDWSQSKVFLVVTSGQTKGKRVELRSPTAYFQSV